MGGRVAEMVVVKKEERASGPYLQETTSKNSPLTASKLPVSGTPIQIYTPGHSLVA
jgi:hypothetical protein